MTASTIHTTLSQAAADTPTWAILMLIVSVLVSAAGAALAWFSRREGAAGQRAEQAGDRALDARLDAINAKLDLVQTEVRGIMQRHDADIMRLYDRVNGHGERLVALETLAGIDDETKGGGRG